MNEIFVRAGVGPPSLGVRRPMAVAALRPSRSGSPSVTLLIAVVAGLVGVAAGALVIRTPAAQIRPEPRVVAQTQPLLQPQPQAAPPIALAEAAPAPTPGPARPDIEVSPAPAKTAAVRPRTMLRPSLASARTAQARPPIRLPIPVAQPASCEQDEGGEACRRAVVQADRHLRSVYEGAIRRGVSRSTLVDYRDRWADLRDRETDNPARLIESYGALAYDLGRERADFEDEDDTPRPRGRSGLKALADLLLPWR
ncbi:MAG: hypothetical protein ACXU8Z_01190 [Caulobacteraceae bacterium]